MNAPDNTPSQPPAPEVFGLPPDPQATTLIQDVPCAGCGYSLRGMQETGKCPECGLDVRTSLEGARIAPEALARMNQGCAWLRGGLIASVIAQVGGVLLLPLGIIVGMGTGILPGVDTLLHFLLLGEPPAQAAGAGGAPGGGPNVMPGPMGPSFTGVFALLTLVPQILTLLVMIAMLVGTWKYTTPTHIETQERWHSARRLARTAAATGVGAILVGLTLQLAAGGPTMGAPTAGMVAMGLAGGALGSLGTVASAILLSSLLLTTRRLARQLTARRFAERAGVMGWWVLGIYLVGSCLVIGPLVATVITLALLERAQVVLQAALQRAGAPGRPLHAPAT